MNIIPAGLEYKSLRRLLGRVGHFLSRGGHSPSKPALIFLLELGTCYSFFVLLLLFG